MIADAFQRFVKLQLLFLRQILGRDYSRHRFFLSHNHTISLATGNRRVRRLSSSQTLLSALNFFPIGCWVGQKDNQETGESTYFVCCRLALSETGFTSLY